MVKEYALPKQFTKIKKKGLKLTYILTPANKSKKGKMAKDGDDSFFNHPERIERKKNYRPPP